MAKYRLSAPAEAQIDDILAWSQVSFGDRARERYAALIVTAIEEIAEQPDQAMVAWRRVGSIEVGLYHIGHSRTRVPHPPGAVGEPRHYLVFRVGSDDVVDILGLIHERMLLTRALRRVLRGSQAEL